MQRPAVRENKWNVWGVDNTLPTKPQADVRYDNGVWWPHTHHTVALRTWGDTAGDPARSRQRQGLVHGNDARGVGVAGVRAVALVVRGVDTLLGGHRGRRHRYDKPEHSVLADAVHPDGAAHGVNQLV